MRPKFRNSFGVLLCGCLIFAVTFSGCDIFRPVRKLAEGIEAKSMSCEPGSQGGTITLALQNGPTTFNPYVDASPDTYEVMRNLYTTLLDYDYAKNKVEDTGLATTVTPGADGQSFSIKVRKALFSDGSSLDAEDVVFSYQACVNPDMDSLLGDLLRTRQDKVVKEPTITKVDGQTLTVKFGGPISPDVARLIFARIPIVSKNSFGAALKSGSARDVYGLKTAPDKIVTSGPYKVASCSASELVLKANEKYYKTDSNGTLLPYLDEVKYLLNLDRKAQSDKFAAGALDACNYLTAEKLKSLKGNNQFLVDDKGGSLHVWALIMNTRYLHSKRLISPVKAFNFAFDKFRLATSKAINRDKLVQEVAGGAAKPAFNIFTPGNTAWFDSTAKTQTYNVTEAKAVLTGEGYKYTGNELKALGKELVRFSIAYPKDSTAAAIAKQLVADFTALGAEVRATEEKPEVISNYLSAGTFDAVLVELRPEWPDPIFLQPYVTGKRYWAADPEPEGTDMRINFGDPAGKWYDDTRTAIDKAVSLRAISDRKAQYNIVQQRWSEVIPVIYLMSENTMTGAKTSLKNLQPAMADPGITWNLEVLCKK